MKNLAKFFGIITSIVIIGFSMVACEFPNDDDQNGNGNNGGGGGGGGKSSAISLTENIWTDGSIEISDREVWYSFTAVAGTTYRIWKNDGTNGDGTKTINSDITIYDSNNTVLYTGRAWSSPGTVNLLSGSTIYVKVHSPYLIRDTGTFAIAYSTNNNRDTLRIKPPTTHTTITANQWVNGNIANVNGEVWYSFTASQNTLYGIWWNDSKAGDKSKTLNAQVRAYDSNGSTLFSTTSTSWLTASLINVPSGGTVYLRVLGNSGSNTGTFGIIYGTGFVRPDIGHTTLTENIWSDGSIELSGNEVWYSFTAAAGTTYRVWKNDGTNGDGTKTINSDITIYDSNRNSIYSGRAWSSPGTINLLSGSTIYIKVHSPYLIRDTGTFSVVYSTGSTRP